MREGDRVKLRAGAALLTHNPGLVGQIGVVGSLVGRSSNPLLHVRFAPPVNMLVLNVAANQFECVDDLEPLHERGRA